MEKPNPVLVEVSRGGEVESRHRGAAVVVDATGKVIGSWGNIGAPVFARSAMKPVQALPLIETGAARGFSVSDAEIALACGSHEGEPEHIKSVAAWLGRIGLGPDNLQCGTPSNKDSGRRYGPLANNCSGKHAGFLTTAAHLEEPLPGYTEPDHPVQRRVSRVIGEMTGIDLGTEAIYGIDGCSIPSFALPLTAIALAMARMADPRGLDELRIMAIRRVIGSMTGNPFMVAGSGLFDTVVMKASEQTLAVKAGAEGVHIAIIPKMGYGAALKIDDGSRRAADTAMAQLLCHLDTVGENAKPVIDGFLNAPVLNVSGRTVGRVFPSAEYRETGPSGNE